MFLLDAINKLRVLKEKELDMRKMLTSKLLKDRDFRKKFDEGLEELYNILEEKQKLEEKSDKTKLSYKVEIDGETGKPCQMTIYELEKKIENNYIIRDIYRNNSRLDELDNSIMFNYDPIMYAVSERINFLESVMLKAVMDAKLVE